MAESSSPPSQPEPASVPRAFTVSECRDELDVASRVLRRHFWRRLLPGVGVTTYMAVSAGVGTGAPALAAALLFGAFTTREALAFRQNLVRLRDLEDELAELSEEAGVPRVPPEARAGSESVSRDDGSGAEGAQVR